MLKDKDGAIRRLKERLEELERSGENENNDDSEKVSTCTKL